MRSFGIDASRGMGRAKRHVVVGLRPYTAKANILPEQTIGRGLRLMFRELAGQYQDE